MFPEERRMRVGLAPTSQGVVVQPERRARELDRPEKWVIDIDDEALAAGLLPVVDAVERPHLPGRDAELG